MKKLLKLNFMDGVTLFKISTSKKSAYVLSVLDKTMRDIFAFQFLKEVGGAMIT